MMDQASTKRTVARDQTTTGAAQTCVAAPRIQLAANSAVCECVLVLHSCVYTRFPCGTLLLAAAGIAFPARSTLLDL